MYPWYNSSSASPLQVFQYVAGVEPLFAPVILLILWAVILISTLQFGFARSWIFASFVSMVLSIMFVLTGLLSNHIMVIFIIMTGLGLFFLKLDNN